MPFERLHQFIEKNKELKKALLKLDFEIIKADLRGTKSNLSPVTADSITTFARDATGGVFATWNTMEGRIVYIGSEKECGVFADTLGDAVTLIASFPFAWQDLIRCSNSIDQMKAAIALVEKSNRDDLDPNTEQHKYYLSIGVNPLEQHEKISRSAETVTTMLGLTRYCDVEYVFKLMQQQPNFIAIDKNGEKYSQLM